jgi:FemAB-related protein (PEP-CTERM system-associated)
MIATLPDAGGTWRRVVASSAESQLAHAPEWLPVIQRAYGHDPLYLTAEDDDGRVGVLPAFVVRRPLVGTVVTSMPFLDSGGPCSTSPAMSRILVNHLIAEASRLGARVVELRCSAPIDVEATPAEHKVNMTLSFPGAAGSLWDGFDRSVRNQIRKAERSGLSVELGGVEYLSAFYDAFAERMRDLGSPVHAPAFLRAVLESFGARARIYLVRKTRTTVGGLITLASNDRVTVPWATCLKEYFSLCPNMLLYWEALRTACAQGYRRFDFGRSSRDSGTYRFKWQWGAREEPLYWYRIALRANQQWESTPRRSTAPCLVKMWQHLPLGLTLRLGPRIRRYLVQ